MIASPNSDRSPSGAGTPLRPNNGSESNAPIVVDENVDETYDLDDNASSSASITTSILKYRHENGRRYHAYKDGAYVYPNDDRENDRLDIQHNMFYLTQDGKLFLCPADPEKLHRILDCGTGTGSWAIDVADEYPNAQVIGVDLSPIQPSFVPPNFQSFIDDLEEPWTYGHKFDLIYSRMLIGSIGDWPGFFKQAYENLNPGGWFEIADIAVPYECDDGTFSKDSALFKWMTYAIEAASKFGKPLDATASYAQRLKEAGFVNVVEQKFKWPTNNWPKDPKFKELGMWMYENVGKNTAAMTLAPFTRMLGWTVEEVEVFLVDVRKQFKDPKIHAYAPIYVVYGQKPLTT